MSRFHRTRSILESSLLGVFLIAICVTLTATFVAGSVTDNAMVLGWVFVSGVLGIVFLVRAGREMNQSAQEKQALRAFRDEPWRVRPEWRANEIPSDKRFDTTRIIIAVVLLLVTGALASMSHDDASMHLFKVVAGVIGFGLLVKEFVGWDRHRKFGQSIATLDPFPGRLGRPLEGHIQSGVRVEDAPANGFHVRLSCTEQRVYYMNDEKRMDQDVRWVQEMSTSGQVRGEQSRLVIPFSFALPRDLPPSTPRRTESRDYWELEVSAGVRGINYHDVIEIPVFPPDSSMSSPQATSFNH